LTHNLSSVARSLKSISRSQFDHPQEHNFIMANHRRSLGLFLLGVFIGMGCDSEGGGSEALLLPPLHSKESAILHGSEFERKGAEGCNGLATVAITTRQKLTRNKSTCSGVLIAPRLVLTAAHCLVGYNAQLNLAPLCPLEDLRVSLGPRVKASSSSISIIAVDNWLIHPQYHPSQAGLLEPASPPNDLALVLLKQAADPPYLPAEMDRQREIPEGEVVHLWGFGRTIGPGTLNSPLPDDSGVLRHTTAQVLTGLTPFQPSEDHPLRQSHLLAVGRACFGKEWEGCSGACAGDSGGPLFRDSPEGLRLRGVLSVGSLDAKGRCSGRSIYTDVCEYQEWIAEARSALSKNR
jgi:secreted trypsin-like serine protease